MSQTMVPGRRIERIALKPDRAEELQRNQQNGCVGTELVSETDRVRVWVIRLKPGERIGFHKHVLDYFWTSLFAGRARSNHEDGATYETEYYAGEILGLVGRAVLVVRPRPAGKQRGPEIIEDMLVEADPLTRLQPDHPDTHPIRLGDEFGADAAVLLVALQFFGQIRR